MKKFLVLSLCAMTVSLSLSSRVSAQISGDSASGERIAKQWCSACHLVSNDQAVAGTAVPSFFEIAKDPLITSEQIAGFLADPHPKMPDMSLTTQEIADLTKYIATLAP